MKKLAAYILLVMICLSFSGCAVVMAARQPGYKDINSLRTGDPRADVIAILGSPTASETDAQGNKVDVFQFKQGYSTGAKAARSFGHGVADVLTLGIWEVVGTPTEAVFSGKETAVKVTYDKDNKVKELVYLKGR